MSVSHASKRSFKSAVRRAVAAAGGFNLIERLEDRRLLSATITLVNPENLPASNRLIFNYVQNPDTTVPNVVHDTQMLQIEDTGTTPLIISSMAINGPWAFVGAPTGGYTNVTVNPGTPLSVELQFTQRTIPAHSYNETNYTAQPNSGAAITGSLTINSNDTSTPTTVVTLAGYWQDVSNNQNEPSLQTIVNLLAGYKTVIATSIDPTLNESTTANTFGSEVTATSWEPAIATQPVQLQQLGAFRTEGNNASVYWYTAAAQQSHLLFTDAANQGQTLLPSLANGSPASASFTPTGAFGLRVDNEYSTDSINNADGNTGGGGHHFRFFPLVSTTGNTVPNAYIVAMDYGTLQTENFDFQDNVFVVTNIRPSTTPETPSGFTATTGAHPVLSWTADTYTPVAYNVYSSTTANGTFTLLTSTPITTTTYTDSSNAGTPVYYQLVAVDTTQTPVAASVPATTSANTGPITGPLSYSVYAGQVFTFNPLASASDPTGTINPTTVSITSPNHGGTALVDHTTGLITYTSTSGFAGPTETFTYTVTDSNNQTSVPQLITMNVGATVVSAPVANNEVTTVLSGQSVQVPVLSVDLPVTTFNVSSVALVATDPTTHLAEPANGTAVVNSDGTITYTPTAGFVGGDEFEYTVTDNNGQISNIGVVQINVGVEISSIKGAAHSVTYTDENGVPATVTLNKGTADVYFDGTGTAGAPVKNVITVTGSSLRARQITLTNTTLASVLKVSGFKNGQVNLGGVSDAGQLGSINAPYANLRAVGSTSLSGLSTTTQPLLSTETTITGTPISTAGTLNLAGVKSISLRTADAADIILGNSGVKSTSITIAGTVTDTDLTSSVPISTLKAKAWVKSATDIQLISVPSISNLSIAGEFDPGLTVTSTSKSALNSVKIGGVVAIGSWSIAGGLHAASVVNTSSSWGGVNVAGALGSFTVTKGNLNADITAATITSVKVSGAISSTITTTGNVGAITAGQLVGAYINVGSTAIGFDSATIADIGTAKLSSLKVTGKATNSFSDSSVVADVIGAFSTGPVNAASGTAQEGVAATSIKSAAVNVNGAVINFSGKNIVSNDAISAYLTAKGKTLGTFELEIVTAATPV